MQEEQNQHNAQLKDKEINREETVNQQEHQNAQQNTISEKVTTSQAVQNQVAQNHQSEHHQEEVPIRQSQPAPEKFIYDAGALTIEFTLRQSSIKIHVIQIDEKPQDLQQMLSVKQQNSDNRFCVVLTKNNISVMLRKHFKTIKDIHNYIYENLKDSSKLVVTKEDITFILPCESQKPKNLKINLKELKEMRYRHEIRQNMDDMEQKLLQFSNEQMEFVDKFYLYSEGQYQINEDQDIQFNEWLQCYDQNDDQVSFLEKWAFLDESEQETLPNLTQIQRQERQIQEFEKKFPQFKKSLASYTVSQPHMQKTGNDDKMTINSSSTMKNSVFPPGYVPPHLAKQTASDGLTSDQHLRFQANHSKKQKLKLAKQLLKQGYSTSEVIEKLQAMERASKSGTAYVDPNPAPSQKGSKSVPALSVQSRQPETQNNDRAVKEMLISLIRAKTYKKLQDIHKHMTNQGLTVSMGELKKIIDDIKAKTAQRKAAQNNQ